MGERDGVRIKTFRYRGVPPMLKHIALALLFAGQLIPLPTIEDYEFGNAGHKVECKGESQPDFACALVFNFDPLVPDGIASVSGSEYDLIRGIMLRLDGTLYTTVFDPPLKKENGFSGLEKGTGILARVNGDYLLVRWPNGKEAKAKIIRRESRVDLPEGLPDYLCFTGSPRLSRLRTRRFARASSMACRSAA